MQINIVRNRFQPGNKSGLPRRRGSKNRVTAAKRRLVIEAIADLGCDGRGRDGARGWLREQCRLHPRAYLRLMLRAAGNEKEQT